MSEHQSWQSVLDELQKHNPKTDESYVIVCRAGGKEQLSRTRFMNLDQTIEHVKEQLKKEKK